MFLQMAGDYTVHTYFRIDSGAQSRNKHRHRLPAGRLLSYSAMPSKQARARGPANLEDSLNHRRKRLKMLICSVKLILVGCADMTNYQANWKTWVDRCEQTQ